MVKTIYILGAGSSVDIGLPTTEKQIEKFEEINNKSSELLRKLKKIADELFGKKSDGTPNYTLNDIYNLIDNNLLLHCGLLTKTERIESYQLEQCKKELIAYLFDDILKKLKKIDEKNDARYKKYVDFYYNLAKKEIEEKMNMQKDIDSKEFFVSSYSIINFNWDLLSIMPIIKAHNLLNHENAYYLSVDRNPRLRIYTDFNCEYAKSEKNEVWYPFTENAATIVNNKKYDTTRRVILTKCFYPHGSMNLFKCPSCSKHSYYLGDLKLNGVLEKLHYENKEVYKCPYCDNPVNGIDFDVLVQSNFKTRNSYLEEIRLSMTNELRKAERLVFIGYSMPIDDVDYKTLFKSLNNIKEVYVVLKGDGGSNEFIEKSDLPKNDDSEIKRFSEVFGNKKLYFNFAGVPAAFEKIIELR